MISTSASADEAPIESKPLLRGVSHQAAFFLSLIATVVLLRHAREGSQAISTSIFGGSLVFLFGTSALYHRLSWGPGALRWMRRLDHSAIFVSVAGGFTPLFALVPAASGAHHGALVAIWMGAGAGVVTSFAWSYAPEWIRTAQCVVLGGLGIALALTRVGSVGALTLAPLIAAGVLYAVGGLVYATKRPDPVPRVFGYHEVFHVLIVLGSVPLFCHVAIVLRNT
jgi:hemolysin III